jgi:putative transposase
LRFYYMYLDEFLAKHALNDVMPKFRRYYQPESIVFITSITRLRFPYLKGHENLTLYWNTLHAVKEICPFKILAYVILPDHFHWLLDMTETDGDFSKILHSFKRNYTWNYKKKMGIDQSISLWQQRFWDHVIRDEFDLERHFNYIHWNPVKHGYVDEPEIWDESSFRHWYDRGYYEEGWESRRSTYVDEMDLE